MPQEDHTEEPLKAGMNYGMRQSKRYVTTHDASGKSVFTSVPALLYRERTGYALARTYALSSVPTRLTAHEDLKSYLSDDGEQNATSYTRAGKDITIEGGVSMTCLDMGPGAKSVMHRTVSIDFAIVTEGQVELELDSGEKVVLYSGVFDLSTTLHGKR